MVLDTKIAEYSGNKLECKIHLCLYRSVDTRGEKLYYRVRLAAPLCASRKSGILRKCNRNFMTLKLLRLDN